MYTSAVLGTHAWPGVTCLELARLQLRPATDENDPVAANATDTLADGAYGADDDGGGWGGDYHADFYDEGEDGSGSVGGSGTTGVAQPVPLHLDMTDAPVQAARGQVRHGQLSGLLLIAAYWKVSTHCLCLQVRFAKRAKHVDIKQLKGGMERELHSASAAAAAGEQIGFQDIVGGLAGGDGGKLADLSPHLCFICLLHLANEQSLVVKCLPEGGGLVVENPRT